MSVPEFIREAKVPVGLRSLSAALITERFQYGLPSKQVSHNYSYGVTADLSAETAPARFIVWEVPPGYHYHLEGLRAWQQPLTDGTESPRLYFELRRSTNSVLYNDTPIPLFLDTTPIPGDVIHYRARQNTLFVARSFIVIQITGYVVGQPTLPERLEIMSEGIRIPV